MSRSYEALRVALYSGSCVPHDAISDSLLRKLEIFKYWSSAGSDVEPIAFVQHSGYPDDPLIREVPSAAHLIRHPEFRDAHVHIFEFGIYYALLDAVFLIPQSIPTIGIYHNVTPAELFTDPQIVELLERSLMQRHNLASMTHVASDSEYSRLELLSLGFPSANLSVLPLPLRTMENKPSAGSRPDQPISLLYVGRFVRSKGVLDLLEAVDLVAKTCDVSFQLTLAGNPTFSSPDVLAEVEHWCSSAGRTFGRLLLGPSNDELDQLYEDADVFVIPSYHEGYCMPAIEALAANCFVVAYDSTNLPFVLAGLGTLVPTGQVGSLALALSDYLARISAARRSGGPVNVPTIEGELEEMTWRLRVASYIEGLSLRVYEERFTDLLRRMVPAIDIPRSTVPRAQPRSVPGEARSGREHRTLPGYDVRGRAI